MKKKIVFFTGSRADFGIMSKLIKLVQKKKSNTKLIVSGNHYSKKYGYTFNEIRKEKIKNIVKTGSYYPIQNGLRKKNSTLKF